MCRSSLCAGRRCCSLSWRFYLHALLIAWPAWIFTRIWISGPLERRFELIVVTGRCDCRMSDFIGLCRGVGGKASSNKKMELLPIAAVDVVSVVFPISLVARVVAKLGCCHLVNFRPFDDAVGSPGLILTSRVDPILKIGRRYTRSFRDRLLDFHEGLFLFHLEYFSGDHLLIGVLHLWGLLEILLNGSLPILVRIAQAFEFAQSEEFGAESLLLGKISLAYQFYLVEKMCTLALGFPASSLSFLLLEPGEQVVRYGDIGSLICLVGRFKRGKEYFASTSSSRIILVSVPPLALLSGTGLSSLAVSQLLLFLRVARVG
mmetsp:Transcript_26101/g.41307  ORF Transcript_26101/g.41307 Transcript_26101/m.41307 type:complete len:318 (+) Transcript_26101:1579-2532(+)